MHFDMNLILVILIGKIQRENRDVKIMPQMNEFKGNYGRKERIGFLTDQKKYYILAEFCKIINLQSRNSVLGKFKLMF